MAKSDEFPQSNTTHSPASTLPPDVLSLIFRHACPIPDLKRRHGFLEQPQSYGSPPARDNRSQFVLSAISVYWRQVSMLLTPYIWTSVDLVVSPSTVNEASAILQAFLTYSGQLPLTIAIEFKDSWAYDTKVLVDTPSDEVLYQNTHRIGQLYLRGLPDIWTSFFPSLSNLAHLSIQHISVRAPRPVIITSQCPSLSLKLYSWSAQLFCPELTVLHLQGAFLHLCLEILMTCRNLVELRIREAEQGEEEREETLPKSTLVLPNMEVFEWSVYTSYLTDIALLQHIRMPALKKLVWVEEEYGDLNATDRFSRETFFRNLPPTLVDLHISSLLAESDQYAVDNIFDCIYDALDVECLTVSDVTGPFLNHIFERLSESPDLEIVTTQRRVKLPKLKAVLIKNIRGPVEFDQDKVLRMLEHRFLYASGLDQEPFRLEFPHKGVLLSKFKEELKEMIGRGLKAEIFEGGKPVDWL